MAKIVVTPRKVDISYGVRISINKIYANDTLSLDVEILENGRPTKFFEATLMSKDDTLIIEDIANFKLN